MLIRRAIPFLVVGLTSCSEATRVTQPESTVAYAGFDTSIYPGDAAMRARPTDVGFSFASMWQGILDTTQTWNGVTLALDVDIADTRSPSTD